MTMMAKIGWQKRLVLLLSRCLTILGVLFERDFMRWISSRQPQAMRIFSFYDWDEIWKIQKCCLFWRNSLRSKLERIPTRSYEDIIHSNGLCKCDAGQYYCLQLQQMLVKSPFLFPILWSDAQQSRLSLRKCKRTSGWSVSLHAFLPSLGFLCAFILQECRSELLEVVSFRAIQIIIWSTRDTWVSDSNVQRRL